MAQDDLFFLLVIDANDSIQGIHIQVLGKTAYPLTSTFFLILLLSGNEKKGKTILFTLSLRVLLPITLHFSSFCFLVRRSLTKAKKDDGKELLKPFFQFFSTLFFLESFLSIYQPSNLVILISLFFFFHRVSKSNINNSNNNKKRCLVCFRPMKKTSKSVFNK